MLNTGIKRELPYGTRGIELLGERDKGDAACVEGIHDLGTFGGRAFSLPHHPVSLADWLKHPRRMPM